MIDSFVFAGLGIKQIELDENFLSNDCQFNLICNLPKNVVSVTRQKELSILFLFFFLIFFLAEISLSCFLARSRMIYTL
jgi:hypothetical protein